MWQRWGPGPVFAYESLLSSRRWHVYAGRSFFVLVLLLGMVAVWTGSDGVLGSGRRALTLDDLAKLGQQFFYALAGIQLSLVILAAPAAAAGSICTDRVRGTLEHMMVTDLSDVEIVLGKLAARLAPIVGMILCGVPVAALATLLGGVEFRAIAGLFVVSLSLALLGCALALVISIWAAKTHEVLLAVYVIESVWLLSLPIWYSVSFSSKLPLPAAWFEKANPYVLVFAPYAKPGFARAVDYAAFVGVVFAVSTVLAIVSIARLRRVIVGWSSRRQQRPRRLPAWKWLLPSWPSPTLDGNPVLWREWHYSRSSRLARWLWTGILVVAWSLVAWGSYTATTEGIGIAGGSGFSFGFLLVLLFGFLMLSAMAPTALADERARGSLDVLLATPLSTRAIVIAKWWGVYRKALVLAPLPLYSGIFMAASIPELPIWATSRPASPPLIPIYDRDRLFAVAGTAADFLASSALIVSLGLALATWVRKLGRAAALSVIAYFVTGIGWVILIESAYVLGRSARAPDPFDRARRLHDAALNLSPIFGPMGPVGVLLNPAQYSRVPVWIGIVIAVLIKSATAWLLLWLTIKTFDRCLGRAPESTSTVSTAVRLKRAERKAGMSLGEHFGAPAIS
jgi:ABC-type transport system involved in multi-copper enzyme maturation permease subunit